MEFEQACSEMDYILQHMHPKDLNKIPEDVINFFKENKSILYRVQLDETKNLYEQELKDETKAFIKILLAKYFGGEKEKQELNNILNLEEKIEETKEVVTDMVVYKENIFSKIINKILKWIKIKHIK